MISNMEDTAQWQNKQALPITGSACVLQWDQPMTVPSGLNRGSFSR